LTGWGGIFGGFVGFHGGEGGDRSVRILLLPEYDILGWQEWKWFLCH
jgi:hypothetical protein